MFCRAKNIDLQIVTLSPSRVDGDLRLGAFPPTVAGLPHGWEELFANSGLGEPSDSGKGVGKTSISHIASSRKSTSLGGSEDEGKVEPLRRGAKWLIWLTRRALSMDSALLLLSEVWLFIS
jgi:hypothetical protein